MNKLLLSLLLLSIYGCSSPGKDSVGQPAGECPERPANSLTKKNIQKVTLNSQISKESGIARKNKSIGYTFDAQKGQKLTYNTDEDVCVWVYAPDNELLNSAVLPINGKYTIQVSSPKGSKTFELAMGLDVSKSSTSPTTTSNNTSDNSSSIQPLERPSPSEMIKEYYIGLNNREYQTTWNSLSTYFQNLSGSRDPNGDYIKWWNSVRRTNIGEVRTVSQTQNEATVDAQLQYVMKTGRTVTDKKNRIYLIWNNSDGKWLINGKVKP